MGGINAKPRVRASLFPRKSVWGNPQLRLHPSNCCLVDTFLVARQSRSLGLYPLTIVTMAADTVANLQAGGLARSESKSSRKKKAKAEAAPSSNPAPTVSSDKPDDADSKLNGSGSNEHPYIRELQK
jgi:hypothetical protein